MIEIILTFGRICCSMFLTYWSIHEDDHGTISHLISRIIIISTDNYDSLNQIRSMHRNITQIPRARIVWESSVFNTN